MHNVDHLLNIYSIKPLRWTVIFTNITAKSINSQSVAAPSFDLQQIYIHQ